MYSFSGAIGTKSSIHQTKNGLHLRGGVHVLREKSDIYTGDFCI